MSNVIKWEYFFWISLKVGYDWKCVQPVRTFGINTHLINMGAQTHRAHEYYILMDSIPKHTLRIHPTRWIFWRLWNKTNYYSTVGRRVATWKCIRCHFGWMFFRWCCCKHIFETKLIQIICIFLHSFWNIWKGVNCSKREPTIKQPKKKGSDRTICCQRRRSYDWKGMFSVWQSCARCIYFQMNMPLSSSAS